MSERRTAQRAAISLPVQFTLDDDVVRLGSVENISKTGMLLVSPEMIRAGERIRIMFSEPGSDTAIEMIGRIIRTAAIGSFGIAFVSASSDALGFIERLVSRATPV